MNTITVRFNTTVRQITEMSVTKMSLQKNDRNVSAKKKQLPSILYIYELVVVFGRM